MAKEETKKNIGGEEESTNPQRILELIKTLPVVSVAPTEPPRYSRTMLFYDDGDEQRVYFYFNGKWIYFVYPAPEFPTFAELFTQVERVYAFPTEPPETDPYMCFVLVGGARYACFYFNGEWSQVELTAIP